MKYEATECGFTKDGSQVIAATDAAGSQVIITDNQNPDGTHLLSKPLANHEACVSLGRKVQRHGIDFYDEWGSPLGVFEFTYICAQNLGSEAEICL